MNFIGKIPHPIPKKVNHIYDWKIVEIQQFIDAASTYKKKAIMCLFQSGIGINELTELNHGDLQDEFEKGIILLHLKLTRRKKSVPFRTFFGRDEVKYLRLYLATRKQLKPDSPLRATGKIDRVLIEFWMGLVIGEEKRAYLHMPSEEMREFYMDAEKYLAIEKTSRGELASAP